MIKFTIYFILMLISAASIPAATSISVFVIEIVCFLVFANLSYSEIKANGN